MNEQIEALMIKASNGSCYDGPGEAQLFGDDIKKFAELIVRKCCDIAYEHDAPKMSGPGMIIAGRIEQHFGVDQDSEEDSDETCPRCGEEWSGTSCGLPECGWVVGGEE